MSKSYVAVLVVLLIAALLGMAWLYVETGTLDFVPGGVVEDALEGEPTLALTAIFVLLVAGLGVKAALFPLHGWLPQAMVAPAPVSALLHAVAVVKAGAFGIVRVVYDVYGVEPVQALGLNVPLLALAAATIVYGSIKALQQQEIKKRLDESGAWEDPIVTEISPLGEFFEAEQDHQDYYRNNPDQAYCRAVIRPKMEKFRKAFPDKLK